jgi:hypothetical protein
MVKFLKSFLSICSFPSLALMVVATLSTAHAVTIDLPSIEYTVRARDSLYKITRRHMKRADHWQLLADFNHLQDPNRLSIGTRIRIPIVWLKAKPAAVTLVDVYGEVAVRSKQTPWLSASRGMQLTVGQTLRSGPMSGGRLVFANGSSLWLQSNSQLALDDLSLYAGGLMTDTRVRIQSGRIEIRANPNKRPHQNLEVITPSAVTAVRGTEFLLEESAHHTLVQTTEGKVALRSDQGEVLIKAGFGSIARAGQKPTPPIATQAAPELLAPPDKYTEFPILLQARPQANATAWIVQVSEGAGSTNIVNEMNVKEPTFDLGLLANGEYDLRLWSLDSQGIPSNILHHTVIVDVPRKLIGSPTVLLPQNFSATGLDLHLPDLATGQRYMLTLSTDPEGRKKVWHAFNVPAHSTVPQPTSPAERYILWIWVY